MNHATTGAPRSAAVIGDGIVGIACALELQRRGVATELVGPSDHPSGASIGNAGHIAIEQVEPLASLATIRSLPRRLFFRGGPVALPIRDVTDWLPFSFRLIQAASPQRFALGSEILRRLLATAFPAWNRMARDARAEHLLRADGHYIVWESEATAAAGLAHWDATDCGEARWHIADGAEVRLLHSLVKVPIAGAIRFEGSGQVTDLDALHRALRKRFTELGGVIRLGTATGLSPGLEESKVALADGSTVAASKVIVAAGVQSRQLLEPLGMRVPIIAERGYHVQSASTDWPMSMPPVVFEDRSMIVTRFAGGLRAAGFVEFAKASSPADPRKWERLRANVHDLGISFGEPVRQWFGARPTLPDYLPAIGTSTRFPSISYAFGHQHLGLTLAATTGEQVARMLLNEPTAIDLDALTLDRFR